MSRVAHNPDIVQPADVAHSHLSVDAADLARRYGIDQERVQAILDRLLQPPSSDRPFSIIGHELRFHSKCALCDALHHLPPEAALTVLEQTDLHDLVGRWALLSHLLETASLLTVDELADVLDEFADHLVSNWSPLVTMGVPLTSLGCSWPGSMLSYLYPTKLIGRESIDQVDGERDDASPRSRALRHIPATKRATGLHSYKWAPEEFEFIPSPSAGSASKFVLNPFATDYAKAALIPDLEPAAAQRVEAGRANFLALEIAVLRCLASALRRGNAGGLWTQCLKLLKNALPEADLQFYLQMDRLLYGQAMDSEASDGPGWIGPFRGGLSTLFMVIGHAEKELSIGTMDRTKRLTPSVVLAGDSFRSYFQAINQPWREQLDEVLDLYLALMAQDNQFWEAYQERVNLALQNEFKVNAGANMLVSRKYVSTFEETLSSFAEYLAASLEHFGALPRIQPTLTVVPPDDQLNDGRTCRGKRPAARRPPGLTNISAEEFKERLPRDYADLHRKFGRRPTNLQLANKFAVSETTFKRYRKAYEEAGGRWPPPFPNN